MNRPENVVEEWLRGTRKWYFLKNAQHNTFTIWRHNNDAVDLPDDCAASKIDCIMFESAGRAGKRPLNICFEKLFLSSHLPTKQIARQWVPSRCER